MSFQTGDVFQKVIMHICFIRLGTKWLLSDQLAVNWLPVSNRSLKICFVQTGNGEHTWNKHVSKGEHFFVKANGLCFRLVLHFYRFHSCLMSSWHLLCKLQAICYQSNHKGFFSAALWTSMQPVSAKECQQPLTNWSESSFLSWPVAA